MVCLTRVYFVILLLAKKEAQMDEREQDYLKHQIRELERSNHRWKFATFALAAAFAIFLIVGGGSSLLFGLRLVQELRVDAMRAVAAEQAARLQAEQAAQQLQQMKKQAKEKEKKVEVGARN